MAAEDVGRRLGSAKPPFWYDREVRGVLAQVFMVVVVVAVAWYLVGNAATNLAERHIASGFGFLAKEAGFDIGESVLPFQAADTYSTAVLVGIVNTLEVAVIGIVFATILGTLLGIARLSTNWLLRTLAATYVEVIRNTPLVLQLLFWYGTINVALPPPRQALQPLPGFFLSNRGFRFPLPANDPLWSWILLALVAGAVIAWAWARRARAVQMATGQAQPILLPAVALIVGLPVAVWLVGGMPAALDVPHLQGFNFAGGGAFSPELAALLTGLVVYTASYVAEIVRAGILAVPHGQTEAARALGLPGRRILRLVVLPQALRVIVPPITSQYLNLTKNSSLAVVIGFPDLVSITNTMINQTGQAVEGILMQMAVYLAISLGISLFMNWYNARIALVER